MDSATADDRAADAALTDLGALEALVDEEEQELADEADVAEVPEAAELEARPAAEERGAAELHVPLEMYFRDLAEVAVLTPGEELAAWKRIEALELAWWHCAFSFPPIVHELVDALVPRVRGGPEVLAALAELAAAPAATERFASAVERASEKLVAIDIGRDLQRSALARIRKAHRDSPELSDYLSRLDGAGARVRAAKADYARANLRLVVSLARRYDFGRLPLSDLVQEGNLGLLHAIDRFDYRRGFRFSTYASWWIRHAINRALSDKGRAVRLPVHVLDKYHRLARAKRDLTRTLGRPPTIEELSEATDMTAERIERMRGYLLDQSVSLDRPVGDDDEGKKLVELISDPSREPATPVDDLVRKAMKAEALKAFEKLEPMEADILTLRFGLENDRERSLREIGQKYQLSRERIRQLEAQALKKLRRALHRRGVI